MAEPFKKSRVISVVDTEVALGNVEDSYRIAAWISACKTKTRPSF